jgi:23S rRNA (pseudouridine1915-N3)-methyltransferase
MKTLIIAIGKEKDFAAYDLVREYTERIERYCPCEWRYISGSTQAEDNEKLLKALDREREGAHIVVLDEIGKEIDSRALADRIQSCMNQSARTLVFAIGGSYGLSDSVRGRADLVLSLSRLTFPHQIVRLVLAEQIYRAFTIIRGEKYHH